MYMYLYLRYNLEIPGEFIIKKIYYKLWHYFKFSGDKALCLTLMLNTSTVNPRYNDSICSQRRCHENEFAVVDNT